MTKDATDSVEVTDLANMSKVINVGDNEIRYFKVSAVNSVGESDLSSEKSAQAIVATAPVAAPTGGAAISHGYSK